MAITLGALAASGTSTTSSNTLVFTTTTVVPNGQRVMLGLVCGNNVDAVAASGGGVSWILVGVQNANNKAGGLSVFMSGPGGVPLGSTITVTLSASNAHKQYIAQGFVLDSQMYVDAQAQQSGGSTAAGLVSSAPLSIGRFNVVQEALGIGFVFNDNPANVVTPSPTPDGSLGTTEGSTGSLTCSWHITESGEAPAVTYSWGTPARYSALLLSVSEVPLAGADVDTTHILWGIGANFTDDSFPDPYSQLEVNTPWSAPGVGGFNRKFQAARFNYALDSTLYPSSFGATINTYAISSYFDGATTIYQNGHPKNPLLNGDTTTSATYWASVAAGVYDTAFLTTFNAINLAIDSASTRLFRQHLPFLYSFSHEQSNNNDTTPNGPGAGTPAQYWPAHSHVYDLLVANGLHVSVGGPIAMCFVADKKQILGDANWGPRDGQGNLLYTLKNAGYTVTNLLSGADLSKIDYAGCDIYSQGQSDTADLIWKPVHDWVVSLGKPMVVPECGCNAANGDAMCVEFWQTVDGYAHAWGGGTGVGNLHMVCFTSKIAQGGDYRMNATQAIYNQFLAMSQEQLWGASSTAPYTLHKDNDHHGVRVFKKQ